ncbi:hypothetical protein GGTG_06821 [Gaeumannomyces tritici R3-111a-1]|uniref:Uncharacterized protein n=1 Tax=Gaeumannomyces tritici (strain R3-111a-1) TaxID=644352 RepID=J3NZX4_GAET3|nr:hypothetical protein GGTG_06821 [Gaeumannomyces tritici R3-111a-1]EJT76907.1 hypothetical protein GGTG_06821 [Gaeumannomyces tritici R3-111a-1]
MPSTLKKLLSKVGGKGKKGTGLNPAPPPAAPAAPTVPAPSAPLVTQPGLPEQLWTAAYAAFALANPELSSAFENIVNKEIARTIPPGETVADNSAALEPSFRYQQMRRLANVAMDKWKEKVQARDGFILAADVVQGLKDRIGAALEVSPPASLGFAGFCLILNGCTSGIEARRSCIEGLTYVVERVEWYRTLTGLVLSEAAIDPANQGQARALQPAAAQELLRGMLEGLFKALIEYQVKSVCAYYGRMNQAVTILKDLVSPNDWDAWLRDIKSAEEAFLRDVETQDALLASRLRAQLLQHAERTEHLMQAAVHYFGEAHKRDERREKRELQQLDDGTRTKINRLIATFKIPNVDYKALKNHSSHTAAAPGTCEWFRKDPRYLEWKSPYGAGSLVLTALPGSGKSVIAKSLVDEAIAKPGEDVVVCYYFFKRSGSQVQATLAACLCSMLHQIFIQRRRLILKFQDDIETSPGHVLLNDVHALWDLFRKTADALEGDAQVICALDGLDEADKESCNTLTGFLREYYNDSSKTPPRLKTFIACRPYEYIRERLAQIRNGYVNLDVGEAELAKISREIDAAIDDRLDKLPGRFPRNPPSNEVLQSLRTKLREHENRTYLWVSLMFEIVEKTELAFKNGHWLRSFDSLPADVDEAYEALLGQVPEESRIGIRHILAAILQGVRGFDINELMVIYELSAIESKHLPAANKSSDFKASEEWLLHTCSASDVEAFEKWLLNTCGFFLQVFHGRVSFIHQTAREFLLDNPADDDNPYDWAPVLKKSNTTAEASASVWKHTFPSYWCHKVLAEACIFVVACGLKKIRVTVRRRVHDWDNPYRTMYDSKIDGHFSEELRGLQHYACILWEFHIRSCQRWDGTEEGIPDSLVDISPKFTPMYMAIVRHRLGIQLDTELVHKLQLLPELHHLRLVPLVHAINPQADWAKAFGKRSRLLLPDLAVWITHFFPDLVNKPVFAIGGTLLFFGGTPSARVLLERGASVHHRDRHGRSILHGRDHYPPRKFDSVYLDLILEQGADINARDGKGQTPLHQCEDRGNLEQLLGRGARIDAKDLLGRQPIHTLASRRSSDPVELVEILLQRGSAFKLCDGLGNTPFHYLTGREGSGWEWFGSIWEDLNVLVEHFNGASHIDLRNKEGETALMRHCRQRNYLMIDWLLRQGADPHIPDNSQALPVTVFLESRFELPPRGRRLNIKWWRRVVVDRVTAASAFSDVLNIQPPPSPEAVAFFRSFLEAFRSLITQGYFQEANLPDLPDRHRADLFECLEAFHRQGLFARDHSEAECDPVVEFEAFMATFASEKEARDDELWPVWDGRRWELLEEVESFDD